MGEEGRRALENVGRKVEVRMITEESLDMELRKGCLRWKG